MSDDQRAELANLRDTVTRKMGDAAAVRRVIGDDWRVEIRARKSGPKAGETYREWFSGTGEKMRSVREVCAVVERAMAARRGGNTTTSKSAKTKSKGKAKGAASTTDGRKRKASETTKGSDEALELEKLCVGVAGAIGRDIRGDGWAVEVVTRKGGKLQGQTYKEFIAPCGNKLRSMKEVMTYLASFEAPVGKKARESERGAPERDALSQDELVALERKNAAAHAALITRAVPAVPERAQTVNVTGLELDEDMDEDRLVVEFTNITGFEPVYVSVEELRGMVNKERARAAVKTIRTSPTFKFNPSTRNPPRLSLGELPNGAGLTREEEESKRADQQALIQKMKAAASGYDDALALGDVSNADWRGGGRVPKFLGNTSVPDVVRGGTRAGAAPKIAGTEAEIKLLPSTATQLVESEDKPPFDPSDTKDVTMLKAAMHTGAVPEQTRCRDDERAKVIDLIQGCLRDHKPGSLYLAGLPGTGKTLTLKDVQRTTERWGISGKTRPRVVFINCMSLRDPKSIFGVILEELGDKVTASDRKPTSEAIEFSDVPEVIALRRAVTELNGGMCIILLDEMDQLVTKAQDVLYELFALPALKESRCVLAGVSNAINLTDRVLPRLRARGCEPALVTFSAYDGKQLKVLLKQRLAKLPFRAFEDSALELCSRKVGAATGDMRKALNVCATAIDMYVREATQPPEDDHSEPGPVEKGVVKIAHMARALSKTYASPMVDSIRALPQMQQMVLCSAVKLLSNSPTMETTIGALHDRYVFVCKSAGVKDLPAGEFYHMCSALADHSLLKVANANNDRLRKVRLLATKDDVVFSLQGVNFFRNLLQ